MESRSNTYSSQCVWIVETHRPPACGQFCGLRRCVEYQNLVNTCQFMVVFHETEHQNVIPEQGRFFIATEQSGLQDRIIVAPYSGSGESWQLIHIQSGALELMVARPSGPEVLTQITAPAFLCQPVRPFQSIRLLAGSSGVHFAVDEICMFAAVGSRPEAVELRMMISDTASFSFQDDPNEELLIARSMNGIASEIAGGQPGRQTIIEAELRCLLVRIWRSSSKAGDTVSSDAPQTILLRKFRQLVEAQYRKRWRVQDFATALGTTPDRLHNVATKSLDRTPLNLIHERTQREAKALLTRSNMTVEQVAAYLGFSTAAQFSAFFRKLEGQAPGRYRTEHAVSRQDVEELPSSSLTDWP